MSDKSKKIKDLKRETERRELVIREKRFGKEIEKIEKSRISSDIFSIQQRINELATTMYKLSDGMIDLQNNFDVPIGSNTKSILETHINSYFSIRKDICYTIEKKEGSFRNKFNDIFPEIKSSINSIKTFDEASNMILNYAEQLYQIRIFLTRYLI